MPTNNTINRLFEKQAAAAPDDIAVIDSKVKITYGELNARANRIAHFLISEGLKPEMFVGIVMDHLVDMVVSILGVIKSGAGYVVMEPDFPRERVRYILEETGASIVLTDEKYSGLFPPEIKTVFSSDDFSGFSSGNTNPGNNVNNILYSLFTSGTTGTPKGVLIEHRNVANYVEAFTREFGIGRGDRMLQCSVCTFDIFVEELFPALLKGATLVIADRKQANDALLLAELMEREKVTIISCFPYLLQELDSLKLPSSLRLAISGGDVLRKEYVENLVRCIPVYNTYGPSETTVCATYYRFTGKTTPRGSVPVGKPVYGVEVYIMDENLNALPCGRTGEICIGGAGVGRCYLNMKEETSKAFVRNPEDPLKILYRSGDLGVMLEDGNIDFLRRIDQQVMIKGKRVEPLEVENVMARYEGINSVLVRPFSDREHLSHLAAYYVSDAELEQSRLVSFLREYIPDYMIPECFIRTGELPKTFNGKVDRSGVGDLAELTECN